jgi:membrane protein implicated in regulation of membrane protease activity
MFEGPAAELFWFVVGLVLLLAELALPGFVVIFFGIGAWITALAVAAGLVESLTMQLVVFLVSSLVCLILFRRQGQRYFRGKVSGVLRPDESLDDIRGERAVVTTDIAPHSLTGKVEYHGTTWMAEADSPIPSGTVVEIVDRTNLVLKVKPVP